MFEIVTKETLSQFETFVEGHPKGHFLQSNLWAPVKPDWAWEGLLSRGADGQIRGAMSVLIRKMPGVPYKLMYAARGPVCDLNDRDALKDLTDEEVAELLDTALSPLLFLSTHCTHRLLDCAFSI